MQATFDFGRMNRDLLTSFVYNVGECLWSEELHACLRLCGIGEACLDENASDYERFCAIAKGLPMLGGHATVRHIQALLLRVFGISKPLTPQTQEEIWRACNRHLEQVPHTMADIVMRMNSHRPLRWLCDDLQLPDTLCEGIEPVFDGTLLRPNTWKASTWEAWQTSAEECMHTYTKHHLQCISFALPREYLFQSPNKYQIERILCGEQIPYMEELWTAQQLRFLVKKAQKWNLTICLRILCAGEEIVKLLRYLFGHVGTAAVVWSTPYADTRDAMLRYSASAESPPLRYALHVQDAPSAAEWSLAVAAAAARYPIERLQILCGTDLRYLTVEQELRMRAIDG